MFYTFRQNNSFGCWDEDDDLAVFVIIEADNAHHANSRAESIGIYFDGTDNGKDCPTCGDRWYPVCEEDGESEPCIYGTPIALYYEKGIQRQDGTFAQSFGRDYPAIVHYLDGTKRKFQ